MSGQTGPGLCDRQMRAELAAAKLEMEVLRAERDKLQTKVVDLSGRLAFTEKCLYAREQIDGY